MDEKKRILFVINTPGQAYTWRFCIEHYKKTGYQVGILARDLGPTLKNLSSFGFEFSQFKPISQKLFRPLEILTHIRYGLRANKKLHAAIVIGFGIDAALLARVIHARSIIFTDNESTPVQNRFAHLLSNTFITPVSFRYNLGKKHIRINGYKELAYLHPNYFKPDPDILDELRVKPKEKYVILRFNSFNAVHDIGKKGFFDAEKVELVKNLEKYARVFISAEGKLAPELEKYKLPIEPYRIHHAIYYAEMLVSDTGTMPWEAAVLGTTAVVGGEFTKKFGNFREMEQKYGLLYSYTDPGLAVSKAIELIQNPDLKQQALVKHDKLLEEKIDVADYFISVIEK
jgi:predicted glycosyltransferase